MASLKPWGVVSFLDPGWLFPYFGGIHGPNHLKLAFHDVHSSEGGQVPPSRPFVEKFVTFLDRWDRQGRLLVHCRAGIGRSTAGGFVAACFANPHISERRIAEDLRRVAPLARPNETLIRVADQVLNRDGRMSESIASTGAGLPWIEIDEGIPYEMVQYTGRSAGPRDPGPADGAQ